MLSNPGGTGFGFTILLVWAIIGIGFLVWYLWAMARLFPRIGLESWEGWIPVWNQWRLLDRAGLPGWLVLFSFVGLGIVPWIVSIIAMHRVNTEAGVSAGYTVLGVFIPPLWATLLANAIGTERVVTPGYASGAGSGSGSGPGYGAGYGTGAGTGSGIAYAAPPPEAYGAQPAQTAAQPWVSAPPATPASQPSAAQPPQAQPISAHSPLGAATDAEFERLAAEPFAAPPAAPLGQKAPPEPFSWTAASRSEEPAPPAQPVAPPMHPAAAAEPPSFAPPSPAPPVPPVAAQPTAPAEPAAAQPDAAEQPPAPSEPVPAPVPAAPPASSAPEPVAPPRSAVPPAPRPALDDAFTASQSVTDPPTGSVPQPVGAFGKATGITGAFPPLREALEAARAGNDADGADPVIAPYEDDPIDDRTIVVPRARAEVWELVLPSGESYELAADVVVGRRPEPVDGSEVLPIPDSTRTLSKSHARLRRDGEQWVVEDLGSTNGLVLLHEAGEVEIEPHRPVAASERMLFGTLEVRLRLGGDSE